MLNLPNLLNIEDCLVIMLFSWSCNCLPSILNLCQCHINARTTRARAMPCAYICRARAHVVSGDPLPTKNGTKRQEEGQVKESWRVDPFVNLFSVLTGPLLNSSTVRSPEQKSQGQGSERRCQGEDEGISCSFLHSRWPTGQGVRQDNAQLPLSLSFATSIHFFCRLMSVLTVSRWSCPASLVRELWRWSLGIA